MTLYFCQIYVSTEAVFKYPAKQITCIPLLNTPMYIVAEGGINCKELGIWEVGRVGTIPEGRLFAYKDPAVSERRQ